MSTDFSSAEWKLIALAIRDKQHRYVTGDKMHREYGAILDECNRKAGTQLA